MICDFCKHEAVIPESRELLIRAWCPNCGAFSDGKTKMKLPSVVENKLPSVEELIVRVFPELSFAAADILERFLKSREKTCTCAEIMADDSTQHFRGCPLREKYPDHPAAHAAEKTMAATLTAAQEAGTNLWNKVVRVKNLLRVAQPYLEEDNARNPDELELAALCNEIAKEIGSLEDNTTEEDGRMVAERLGIDMEKWAAEIRAKVDAADVADAKEKS